MQHWDGAGGAVAAVHDRGAILFSDKLESTINGFVVSSLIDLKAKVAINAIKDAYQNEAVDPSIAGEWPSVEFAMGGLRKIVGSS